MIGSPCGCRTPAAGSPARSRRGPRTRRSAGSASRRRARRRLQVRRREEPQVRADGLQARPVVGHLQVGHPLILVCTWTAHLLGGDVLPHGRLHQRRPPSAMCEVPSPSGRSRPAPGCRRSPPRPGPSWRPPAAPRRSSRPARGTGRRSGRTSSPPLPGSARRPSRSATRGGSVRGAPAPASGATFSSPTMPIEPAITVKSYAMAATRRPSIRPTPVTHAVRRRVFALHLRRAGLVVRQQRELLERSRRRTAGPAARARSASRRRAASPPSRRLPSASNVSRFVTQCLGVTAEIRPS